MASLQSTGSIRRGVVFFDRPAQLLAPDLLGQILVHREIGRERRARIVETEAYLGPRDRASHAFHGRTGRTETLFGPPGRAYVYLIYGIHELLNIVAGKQEGEAQCVLIRAGEAIDGWKADLSGPGKLTKALGIERRHNGLDLAGEELYLVSDPVYRPRILVTRRVGIDYAGEWRDAPLRFLDEASPAVSHPKLR